MRTLFVSACALCALGLVIATSANGAAQGDAKYSIKEVMKVAHKDGLLKKATGDKAEKADQEKLLTYYIALAAAKPPVGDADAWKKRNETIVNTAKDLVAGKDGAGKALVKATNCAACHKEHKG